jgi:hypothetical protein
MQHPYLHAIAAGTMCPCRSFCCLANTTAISLRPGEHAWDADTALFAYFFATLSLESRSL